jgi:hypothetical protein
VAADLGEHEIEHDQIGLDCAGSFERLASILSDCDLVSMLLEGVAERDGQCLIIFGDEKAPVPRKRFPADAVPHRAL